MQIDGSMNGHNSMSHNLTDCIHDHKVKMQEAGGGKMSQGGAVSAPAQAGQEARGQFSLAAWLRSGLAGGRRLLGSIWGGGASPAEGLNGENPGRSEQLMAQVGEERLTDKGAQDQSATDAALTGSVQVAAASAAGASLCRTPPHNQPYFTPLEASDSTERTLLYKVKRKLDFARNYLKRRFAGQDHFRPGQEKPREDMKRHSRYKGEEKEIDCILTDDSYLMDSYDRTGGYTQLTTKK